MTLELETELVIPPVGRLESSTEVLQKKYGRLIRIIQERIKQENVSLERLIAKILTWQYISAEFRSKLIQAKTIDYVFDLIRIYSQWYQIELLDLITDFPALKGSVCLKKLAEYKQQLSTYFESRIEQLSLKDDSETLKLPIDNAWDKKVLQGQHCKKTCKQIALILGKAGRITGHLDGEDLYIAIS